MSDICDDLYLGFYATFADGEQPSHLACFDRETQLPRLESLLQTVAQHIGATAVAQSSFAFAPSGGSALLLAEPVQSDASRTANLHLRESHACVHSYPAWQEQSRGWSRLDFSIATCGGLSPLRALSFLLTQLSWDVVEISYCRRGVSSLGVDGPRNAATVSDRELVAQAFGESGRGQVRLSFNRDSPRGVLSSIAWRETGRDCQRILLDRLQERF